MVVTASLAPHVPPRPLRLAPIVLAAVTVAAQIAYPLTAAGAARNQLTIATVLLFFTASVAHAAVWRGLRFALVLVGVTAGGGLLVEALGVATAVPFGAYRYNDTLGWTALGVPIVIPLAWTMMAYPALLVGHRIAAGWHGVVISGWALASWDLFLDPQMVDAGYWTWIGGSGPTVLGIPLLNFAGWFVIATLMTAALSRVPQRAAAGAGAARFEPSVADDRVPLALYLWVYASSVLAHALFFNLPGSAALGGIGMGIVVIALLARMR